MNSQRIGVGDAGTWFDFHGVAVHLAYAPFAGDAFRALLAPFPPASPREPCLRVELGLLPSAPLADVAGWTPTFFHGLAQGYTSQGRHRLTDGESMLEIRPSEGCLRGWLGGSRVSELASGMQHLSLCMLLREHGLFDAHAAGACLGDQALLLLGDAGSGKTSTLLGLMRAGATYLGDDRVLLRNDETGLALLSYPRDFHLAPATLRAHRSDQVRDAPASIDGKFRVDAKRAWPDQLQLGFRGKIRLLLPEVRQIATTEIRRMNAADAFGRLLAASATVTLEVLRHRERQLAVLTELANSAPAFELRLGQDFLLEPKAAATRLLAELAELG